MSRATIVLRARRGDEGEQQLLAPSVGVFAPSVKKGDLLATGQSVGTLDVLGVRSELVLPAGVAGRIAARIGGGLARVPVGHGDVLVVLSTESIAAARADDAGSTTAAEGALAFVAPMSGRFYSRPSPQEPPFVEVGDVIEKGHTIGLLEVMKTFNRLVYQGDDLPKRACVEQIMRADGEDVVRGDPLLGLSASTEA